MNLQSLLGTELPILQAPMAGAQDSRLAIAVCEAGGLGSLPCALFSLEQAREQIARIRSATSRPFNLNFFCHRAPVADAARESAWRAALAPYYKEFGIDAEKIPAGPGRAPFTAESAAIVEQLKPPIVSFHFGLPSPDLLARVRASGAKILASATTVDEALWLERNGVDAIIAQGNEAGGHRGIFLTDDISTQVGTFALLPQVVRAAKVPVIAAGGIADAQGVRAALALGAIAAQIGTSYLLCPETLTTPIHRAALKSDAARTTALTNLFTGRPARGIVNRLLRELGPMSKLAPEFPLATSAIAPIRARAEAQGSGDFSPLWSGQNATGCKEIGGAELTRQLAPR
jgi:nitronate monooxygenase